MLVDSLCSCLCTVYSTGPWTAVCRETYVYSAAVRDVLISLAFCWIQGTVHSSEEQSEIQQYPPDAWIASNVQTIIIIIWEAMISLTLLAQYHEWEQ